MTRASEFDWISTHLAPLAGAGSFNLQDDAALLNIPAGKALVVTQDAIASGIHFMADDPFDLVARKALRVNISDLVAKGAVPHSYSLALGVPDSWQDDDMATFAAGLQLDQQTYGIHLTGGDTYRSPQQLSVAVTMFSLVDEASYKSRLGAQPGDAIYVTGTIGDAALGLKVARGELSANESDAKFLHNAYQLPSPPTAVAATIARYANASMDISDGLIGDCRKLCSASGVAALVERSGIPLSAAAGRCIAADETLWTSICAGGDDYQVLCTVPADKCSDFAAACRSVDIAATAIGEIKASQTAAVALDIDGEIVSMEEDSFTHF
ncbi:MAG: thiamine-phosphate kinase [Rhizobiaceae bacterium]